MGPEWDLPYDSVEMERLADLLGLVDDGAGGSHSTGGSSLLGGGADNSCAPQRTCSCGADDADQQVRAGVH